MRAISNSLETCVVSRSSLRFPIIGLRVKSSKLCRQEISKYSKLSIDTSEFKFHFQQKLLRIRDKYFRSFMRTFTWPIMCNIRIMQNTYCFRFCGCYHWYCHYLCGIAHQYICIYIYIGNNGKMWERPTSSNRLRMIDVCWWSDDDDNNIMYIKQYFLRDFFTLFNSWNFVIKWNEKFWRKH